MQKTHLKKTKQAIMSISLAALLPSIAIAGTPLWTFQPLTDTTITIPSNGMATIQYQVTNQSRKPHTLVMQPIAGITQTTTSGNCPNPFALGYQQSCTLTLEVDGAALQGNVIGGPQVCQQGSALQCYQPSAANSMNITLNQAPGATTLSASISDLALSVTGLTEYGVTGTPSSGLPRIITITNTGSNPTSNLSVTSPTWPTGTTSGTTCGSTLAAGASCTITVTPGGTATSDGTNPCSGGTAPVAGIVQVSADNATTISTNVIILGYGCIYQGGYVYAFDDTTSNTGSVGGKVATTSDQAAAFPNGVIWSSKGTNGGADVVYNIIYGISETSTTSVANPNSNMQAEQVACNGATDGSCDTNNIYVYYQNFATNAPINPSYYAAGLCKQTINGYSDWYLPAICEMGFGNSAGCGTSGTPMLQNIQKSLIDSSGLSAPAGFYWSSTEDSGNPQNNAWYQFFSSGGGSFQFDNNKNGLLGVRCSRALTL